MSDEVRELREMLRMFWCLGFQASRFDDEDRLAAMRRNSPLMGQVDAYFQKHPWTEDDKTVRGEAHPIEPSPAWTVPVTMAIAINGRQPVKRQLWWSPKWGRITHVVLKDTPEFPAGTEVDVLESALAESTVMDAAGKTATVHNNNICPFRVYGLDGSIHIGENDA